MDPIKKTQDVTDLEDHLESKIVAIVDESGDKNIPGNDVINLSNTINDKLLDNRHSESDTKIRTDIDDEVNDGFDQGYMGMDDAYLEQVFPPSNSSDRATIRQKEYQDISKKYQNRKSFSRYNGTFKHFIPFRKSKKLRRENPVDSSGFFSWICLSWLTDLMWQAYKTGITEDDLPMCSKYDMCDRNTQRLEHLWEDEVKRRGNKSPSLKRVIWRFIRTRIIIDVFIFMTFLFLGFVGPTIFMRYLIDWLSTDEPVSIGLQWAVGLIIFEFVRIILFALVFSLNYTTGVRLRSACMGMVYRKLMRLSSVGEKSIGELINLFATDGTRIYDFIMLGPLIISGPFVTVGGIVFILWLLGPWALLGMLTSLIYFLHYGISRLLGYLRRRTVKVTDERVRMMNELLSCVKLIKMYAWEKSFANTISEIRKRERRLLEKSAYTQSLTLAIAPTVPVIAAIITFMAHIGAGYNLTAAEGLSVVAFLLVNIRTSINMSRYAVPSIADGIVAMNRIEGVLIMDEITPYVDKPKDKNTAIFLKDATLAWNSVILAKENKKLKKDEASASGDNLLPSVMDNRIDVLIDVNVLIKKGELIGVCGGVGAGKSSLISALLGQMRLQSGEVHVDGTCGYVGQQAWILNTSLRENILLGEKFDAKRYYRVIYACNLIQDVTDLPAGDSTEIGERGINLSGGQKQRVSLARALYANKDIYLLDDPLSAVDAHVGQHIFQWVIKGALKEKTAVVITHQLQYLPQCDRVLFIKGGCILECGTHKDLMDKNEGYASLFNIHLKTVENENKGNKNTPKHARIRRESSLSTTSSHNSTVNLSPKKSISPDKDEGVLMTEEKLEKGDIPASTYHSYIQYVGGYFIAFLVIVTFIINVGSTAFSSWWLSFWLSAGSGNTTIMIGNETVISDNIADNPDRWFYQTVYGLTIVIILGSSLLRGFTFMKTTLKASSKMHDLVFMQIFRSPMRFFETTPSGRIINIFSRDMDEVDVRLPMTMETLLQNMGLILCSLTFVCLIFPYFLGVLALLAVIFFIIRNIFKIGVRDLKRLENVSRSPLYSHISTTVNGLATINAYQKQRMFIEKFQVLFDENSCAFYLFNCAMRWLAIRLDILALLVTASTALLSLVLRSYVEAAFAGLALAYAAQLSGIFQFTVRLSTETEARFTSVQRINNYIKCLDSEGPTVIESSRPKSEWPKYGRISFKKVQMRYRPETSLVLKRISFEINSEEKIGVVGRTGSGKSSLGVVLFRLVELCGGSIKIDGVDIASLGLQDLRSRLSIIPQDPVLFIGTIRYNLDPFKQHTDNDIWSALEQTFMKETIADLPLQLLAPVVENGENFSVGERQLICMARALLRNSKILFLDEATAAIDSETDSKIQQTLKIGFKNCTMITVAHRLNTVMSCSRIIVMKEGEIAEFDTPTNLLEYNSIFAKMISDAESSVC